MGCSRHSLLRGASLRRAKIRGGYGIMGNSNNVDPNNQYSLYQTNVGNSSYPISDAAALEGYYRSRIGNPYAKWEKAVTTNIGFDGTFLNGKMDVIVDFWNKDTQDLLFQVPITVTNGSPSYVSAPSVNVGKMRNKGIDIQIITRGKITGKVGYEVTVNGGFLDNKIVALNPGSTYLSTVNPSFRGINPIRNQLGRPAVRYLLSTDSRASDCSRARLKLMRRRRKPVL